MNVFYFQNAFLTSFYLTRWDDVIVGMHSNGTEISSTMNYFTSFWNENIMTLSSKHKTHGNGSKRRDYRIIKRIIQRFTSHNLPPCDRIGEYGTTKRVCFVSSPPKCCCILCVYFYTSLLCSHSTATASLFQNRHVNIASVCCIECLIFIFLDDQQNVVFLWV
jgi:hypothetical protein